MSHAQRYAVLAADVVAGLPADLRPRVGTDVQYVAPVLDALDGALRDAYLARLFTPGEQLDCAVGTADPQTVASALAARFAVKEAVVKVLRPGGDIAGGSTQPRPPWTDIEIRRQPDGSPRLILGRAAATLAHDARLTSWDCSFSHDGEIALATVIALQSSRPDHRVRPREVRHAHR